MALRLIHRTLTFQGTSDTDVIDITDRVRDILEESGVEEARVTLFVPGSTAALTTIEYESGVVNDLVAAINRLAPKEIDYAHDRRWGDGNGYSHVRAALLGPSLTIPVHSGRLTLGTWQQVVLLDFDNRPRQRKVILQIMGEAADLSDG